VLPVFKDLYERVRSGAETQRVIEACGAADYQEKLRAELNEMGNSELWRAGKATRALRPTEPARQITSETKGVSGRDVN
jgi:ketol-acid reductoisomerase